MKNVKKHLFPNYGWKKNLLAVAVSILICFLASVLSNQISLVRGISQFDLTSALLPLFGFSMGIWWVAGFAIYSGADFLFTLLPLETGDIGLTASVYAGAVLPLILFSILPAILWYGIRLKGESKTEYPRLDTSAHVIKYYLIMLVSVAFYILLDMITMVRYLSVDAMWLRIYWFFQYLDVILIVGIPFLIAISMIRNRTLTINERMVLAFLVIGVIAAAAGAYFVYRNTMYLSPSLFEDYEALMKPGYPELTDDVGVQILERYETYWNRFYVMTAVMLNGLLLIEMAFMSSIERKVTKPVLHLANVLEQYAQPEGAEADEQPAVPEGAEADEQPAVPDRVESGEQGGSTENSLVDNASGTMDPATIKELCRPYRYGYGEISSLTRTFVNLTGRVDTYTKNLRQVTAEKERIGTELDVASKIQRDMLPGVFPPFPNRKEFSLYASMTPAKEVGGDFYDFYFIDEDHLALTIADVSGKGVPAALFMVISKTLLKNQAQRGSSPKEILTYVNHQLSQNNETMMFCTAWVGILDLRDGKLTAANAGHEYPAVRRRGGSFELMKNHHGPGLGVFDGIRYSEYEITLAPGDCLFVYTDGVPEATDASETILGEERMVRALNTVPDAGPEDLIGKIHETIRDFVKEEPQFDDITMLSLQFLEMSGQKKARETLTVPARVENLGRVMDFISALLEADGCQEDTLFSVSLAVEEIFVNIANYAYEGGEGDVTVDYSFEPEEKLSEIVFCDSGLPFDPTARPAPDITLKPDERQIGGLGIYIVKQTMDEVNYQYSGGKNILTIRKKI